MNVPGQCPEDAIPTHADHVAQTYGDFLNNYVHLWGHRYIYDEETLRLALEEAGFTEVERATFGQSRHAVLRGIDRHEMDGLQGLVLCLDAVKPQSALPAAADV